MNGERKIVLFVLILCLWIWGTAIAYGQKVRLTPGRLFFDQSTIHGELRLSTSILNQDYCFDGYSPRLHLSLKLNFTNVGSVPVLLDKRSSVVPRMLISRNLKAAAAKRYVYDATYTYNSRQAGLRWTFPEQDFFVILKPNESFSLATEIGLALYDGTKNTEDELHPRNYLLQMKVLTWYYAVPPEPYRERWKEKGYLWSKTLLSEPMPFTILKVGNNTRCSPTNSADL